MFLKKLVPLPIRRIIHERIKRQSLFHFAKLEETIPKYELKEHHLKNLAMLPNRSDLLNQLPKRGTVAEMGVAEGNFSQLIIEKCNPSHLFLIDPWDSDRYSSNMKLKVEERFADLIKTGQVSIKRCDSVISGKDFPDHFFDWIYIDTDHSYKKTKEELETYRMKIKSGGFIAGHDFIQGNWHGMVRYGVIEAVCEFCISYDWEMVFLTMEVSSHPSFAIRTL